MGIHSVILLDTHMWIWMNLMPERLPPELVKAFENESDSFGISVISIWETMVAMEKGRVSTKLSPESAVRLWLAGSPFQVIPLDTEIVVLSRTLPFRHDDPADRFIAATAHKYGYPLSTIDDRLRQLPWLSLH